MDSALVLDGMNDARSGAIEMIENILSIPALSHRWLGLFEQDVASRYIGGNLIIKGELK